MSTVVLLLVTGLGLGALYFLVASGLSLIYGLMGVLNFAARVLPDPRRLRRLGDRPPPRRRLVGLAAALARWSVPGSARSPRCSPSCC